MRLNFTKRFKTEEDGGLSIEAVLAIPMLVWAVTATFVFFDAFKTLNISQKATYTVADMLSREEVAITPNYLTAVHELYDFLSESDGDNALRVSVVTMNEDPTTMVKTLSLVWSEGVGGLTGYTNMDVLEDRIPDMVPGDQLIVVESEQEWTPAFAVGLTSYRFREVAIARPRFAPQLTWSAS